MVQERWADGMFSPNLLMPAGVAVTGGYDAIQPFALDNPSGQPWDFPGTTHFLGQAGRDAPVGWTTVWQEQDWHLLRNPEPIVAIASAQDGQIPIAPHKLLRPTPNTMKLTVPQGTQKVSIFSNWHRGWRYKLGSGGTWQRVGQSATRGIEIKFTEPLTAESCLMFRFDPRPPVWVMILSLASLFTVGAIWLLARPRLYPEGALRG